MEKVNILVVTDAQVDFHDGALGTKEAKASVPAIVKKIKTSGDAGHLIYATKDTHYNNYLETMEGKNLPVPHTIIEQPGWYIVPEIEKAMQPYDPVVIIKHTFGSIALVEAIKGRTTQCTDGKGMTITLIGWCTDICVIANAVLLKTAFPEAEIIVDSKCCAGVTPETHNAALTTMKSLQITVI